MNTWMKALTHYLSNKQELDILSEHPLSRIRRVLFPDEGLSFEMSR